MSTAAVRLLDCRSMRALGLLAVLVVAIAFYGDYCSAFIRTFHGVANGVAQDKGDVTDQLSPAAGIPIEKITSFGEDARGELYVLGQPGDVFAIVPR